MCDYTLFWNHRCHFPSSLPLYIWIVVGHTEYRPYLGFSFSFPLSCISVPSFSFPAPLATAKKWSSSVRSFSSSLSHATSSPTQGYGGHEHSGPRIAMFHYWVRHAKCTWSIIDYALHAPWSHSQDPHRIASMSMMKTCGLDAKICKLAHPGHDLPWRSANREHKINSALLNYIY